MKQKTGGGGRCLLLGGKRVGPAKGGVRFSKKKRGVLEGGEGRG